MTVTISDVAYRGKGLARAGGLVVFVPHTLPGETVDVEVVRQARNFAEARLLRIAQASPARAAPGCPLTGTCPGCCYRHATYEEEIRLKQAQLANLLERMAKADVSLLLPPTASPAADGYRNKIVLHGAEQDGRRVLGYFSEDNATVLDVTHCPLAAAPLNRRLAELRGDAAFMETARNHLLLTLRHTPCDGTCHWIGKHPSPKPWLTESGRLGDLHVPRGSFFQVNPLVADALLARFQEVLTELQSDAVLDLYCGVGVFALAAAAAGVARVMGVDADSDAIEAAAQNAVDRKLSNAVFKAGPAERFLRDAARTMRGQHWTLVVDPPRAGLTKPLLRDIGAAKPDNLIYVSCAPDTLARDIRRLAEFGYGLRSARLFDMFPRTPYFETLAVLRQK